MKLTPEDIKEIYTEHQALYRKAKDRGSIGSYPYNGHRLEYALVTPDELLEKQPFKGKAFSTLLVDIPYFEINPMGAIDEAHTSGNYMTFIVEGDVPEEYYGFLAVHEHVEATNGGHHGIATREEFKEVAKRGVEFLKDYSEWWIQNNEKLLERLSDSDRKALNQLLPEVSIDMLVEKGYPLTQVTHQLADKSFEKDYMRLRP